MGFELAHESLGCGVIDGEDGCGLSGGRWYVSDGEAFLDDLAEEGQFGLDRDLGVLAPHAHSSALQVEHHR